MADRGPIVLPLDGSELAEGALPYAVTLAGALGAKLHVVTVWEGTEKDLGKNFPSMASDIETKAAEHFAAYFAAIQEKAKGVTVGTEVRKGDAADEILAAVKDADAHMLVIGTHGRSGIGRWFYGSTAAHLLRHTSIPLLAVGPHALQHGDAPAALKHIVVPLDGTPLSEAAIAPAEAMAKALGARLSLIRVVRWAVESYPYTLPQSYVPQVDDELETGAKAYLRRMEERVTAVPVEAFVVRGAVAESVIEFIEQKDADLVVMTTHARGGLARMALGSTADRVLQGNAPVLLIRPKE